MRNFNMVVLERLKNFSESFATEPYEVGWASEAIFFIRVHEIEREDVKINASVQISSDGIHWVNEGTVLDPASKQGDYFVKVSHFGGWLRLQVNLIGNQPDVKLTIQLVLKE